MNLFNLLYLLALPNLFLLALCGLRGLLERKKEKVPAKSQNLKKMKKTVSLWTAEQPFKKID